MIRFALGLSLLIPFLGGCATPPQTLQLRRTPPADLPPRVELRQAPFFPQKRYQCGPAALATAIDTVDPGRVQPQQLVDQVYVPALKGSLQASMRSAASRLGLLALELDGRLESLLRELAAGNPVLVLQNLGFAFWPFWHYAVIVGYDLPEQRLWLRSGEEYRLERGFSLFEKTWNRAGRWAVVVVLPDRMPPTATPDAFVEAALLLERNANPTIAMAAYRSGLQRWPDHPLMLYGLGNSAYAAARFETAAQVYQRLLTVQPQRAEVWNNLAYALLRQGRRNLAIEAVEKARELQPDNPEIRASYREITKRDGRLNLSPVPR